MQAMVCLAQPVLWWGGGSWGTPGQDQGTALMPESNPASELLTFLHLLAGSGSSSASDELEEPGSLSASARKQASEKEEQ